MPRVIVTRGAVDGMERCRQFLNDKNPLAAKRAAQVIAAHLRLLETTPDIGRPSLEVPWLRGLIIPFGDSGYVALYRHVPDEMEVVILAFRHQKEAGY